MVNDEGIACNQLQRLLRGDVGFAVLDRLKAEMLHQVGLPELLTPPHS